MTKTPGLDLSKPGAIHGLPSKSGHIHPVVGFVRDAKNNWAGNRQHLPGPTTQIASDFQFILGRKPRCDDVQHQSALFPFRQSSRQPVPCRADQRDVKIDRFWIVQVERFSGTGGQRVAEPFFPVAIP